MAAATLLFLLHFFFFVPGVGATLLRGIVFFFVIFLGVCVCLSIEILMHFWSESHALFVDALFEGGGEDIWVLFYSPPTIFFFVSSVFLCVLKKKAKSCSMTERKVKLMMLIELLLLLLLTMKYDTHSNKLLCFCLLN